MQVDRVQSRHVEMLAHVGLAALVIGTVIVFAACSSKPDPSKPLTADQGDALLRDVREHPDKLNDLTPAEKQYLMRTLKK
jgi:hypothetical protein